MIIREATSTDVDRVYEMSVAWEGEAITYGLKATSREELETALGPYFLVAEVDDIIEGFVTGSVHISDGMAVIPAGSSYLEIDELYVTAAWRSHGIGRALVEKVLFRAEVEGLGYQLVYSATKDIYRVMHFYEQCGFEEWYVQLFRKPAGR